jgi:hypothetical protein
MTKYRMHDRRDGDRRSLDRRQGERRTVISIVAPEFERRHHGEYRVADRRNMAADRRSARA